MENTILEAVKLFMAILGMVAILYLLFKNMLYKSELLCVKQELEESKAEYHELCDKMVLDITLLERKIKNQRVSYENKIDKLEEVIHNLEKNKQDE